MKAKIMSRSTIAYLALLCPLLAARSMAAAPAADASSALQEIIVTAEKRDSTVQATAIAITALSAGDLSEQVKR